MPFIKAAGRALEFEWLDAGDAAKPVLVFLHEGLGSIRQWRDFPMRVAKATGCRVLAYNRYGYGNSDPLESPHETTFMHDEARVALPQVLEALGVDNPVLVGHSDGASIALIHAGSGHAVRGVVVEAPHVFVEEHGLGGIVEAKRAFESGSLRDGLAKYHRDPGKTFRGWNDVWLSPAFRSWNIEGFLPGIQCPVLAIQGEDDQYGTMAQLEAIRRQVSGPCELLKLPACGHSPHRDQPEAVAAAIARFVESVLKAQAA
jgi:pimeloyl-ACP methyl ester carboxylesterase